MQGHTRLWKQNTCCRIWAGRFSTFPHSPDIAFPDFHLFGRLRDALNGKSFGTQGENLEDYLFRLMGEAFYCRGIEEISGRWRKIMIDNEGDHTIDLKERLTENDDSRGKWIFLCENWFNSDSVETRESWIFFDHLAPFKISLRPLACEMAAFGKKW